MPAGKHLQDLDFDGLVALGLCGQVDEIDRRSWGRRTSMMRFGSFKCDIDGYSHAKEPSFLFIGPERGIWKWQSC